MLSFIRGARTATDRLDSTGKDANTTQLGLAWVRKHFAAEMKLRTINENVNDATVQFTSAIFGENFYPPVYEFETEKELQLRLEDAAKKAVEKAISIFDETDGWSAYGSQDGVQISQKKLDKSLPVVLKGEYTFLTAQEAQTEADPITLDDVFQLLRNTENRGLYDTMFKDGLILRRHNSSVLSYQTFNGMMGLPGRDFIINGFDKHFNDGNRIVIAGCTPSTEDLDAATLASLGIPEKADGLVRAHCYIVAYDIRKNDDGSITVAAISQPDLGGMIPQMIQKLVVTSHVVTLSKIKRWIKDNKSHKGKTVPTPELFVNHNSYLPLEQMVDYYQTAIESTKQK